MDPTEREAVGNGPVNHWFRLITWNMYYLIIIYFAGHIAIKILGKIGVENELTWVANVSLVCNQSYSMHTRK